MAAHFWERVCSNLRGPSKQKPNGKFQYRTNNRYQVPYAWWGPFIKWSHQQRWSLHARRDEHGISEHHKRSTWIEIIIAFRIQIGFCLDAELDMCSQEKIIKTMFPKVANVAKITQSGERSNVEQTSLFALHVTRFDAIIGHSRPGICRCPLIPDSACEQIIKICTFAYDFGNNRSTFGIGMRVQVHVDAIQKRIPFANAIMADIQRQIRLNEANRQKGDSSVITCHVGGTVDDSNQVCDFRYQETSARGRVEMVWRRNPMPALWIGKVSGGVVICS